MDYELSDAHKLIRDAARRIAREKVAPRAAELDESGEYPQDIFGVFAEAGLLGLTIPEQYGGSGAGFLALALAVEETAKHDNACSLILLLAVNVGILQGPKNVWPRRTLLLSFLLLAATAAAYRERRAWRPVFVAILTAGMLWQVADTIRWSRQPLGANAIDRDYFSLPYVHNTLDYTVPFALVAGQEVALPEALLYNLLAYDENPGNPAGLLERLYLGLGHARFMDSVIVFGDDVARWNRMPLRPMATVDAFVHAMDEREEWVAYAIAQRQDHDAPWTERFRAETYAIMRALETRFVAEPSLELNDRLGRQLVRYILVRRVDPIAD